MAIRVVCMLDPFVMGCCDVAAADTGVPDAEGEIRPDAEEPTLIFPADVDWRSVGSDMMYRILTLPNEIESAKQTIQFAGDMVAFPPDYDDWFQERTFQYGKLGLSALDLAIDLRAKYSLPLRDYNRYDPRDLLEGVVLKEEEMRRSDSEVAMKLAGKSPKKKPANT
ncbi:hypothetical protein [Mesorhizobium sp. A623]